MSSKRRAINLVSLLFLLSSIFNFTHLSPAVSKKYTSFSYFRGNEGIMLHTLARKTKVSRYKR